MFDSKSIYDKTVRKSSWSKWRIIVIEVARESEICSTTESYNIHQIFKVYEMYVLRLLLKELTQKKR